jgi:hypothetical protein
MLVGKAHKTVKVAFVFSGFNDRRSTGQQNKQHIQNQHTRLHQIRCILTKQFFYEKPSPRSTTGEDLEKHC